MPAYRKEGVAKRKTKGEELPNAVQKSSAVLASIFVFLQTSDGTGDKAQDQEGRFK